ncbi:MAG: site-2 protease family protein [Pirellulales bacterium]
MFLQEPQQTQFDLNFSLFGIPVRVHPLFWLVSLLLGLRDPEPGALMIWVGVVFVSILVHELGHALMAQRFGFRPWITLYSFGGLASYNSSRSKPGEQILILLAGPGAGFVLAAVVAALLIASRSSIIFLGQRIGSGTSMWQTNPQLAGLVFDLLYVNIFWGLINLFPVFPLDGGQISRTLFMKYNPWQGVRQSIILSVITGAAMAGYALLRLEDFYLAFLFGYLAYLSYASLQGPWGGMGRY